MDGSLDAAARRLAAIVEFSEDAIVSKDLNGVVTSWNLAAERMFGYTAAEAVGQSITLIVPADRLSEEEHVLREIRAGRAVDHFETMRRRKDGTLLPISLTISPIRDNDGRVVGASKIARDVSERRRAEEALAAAEARQADLRQRLVALVAASGTLFGSPKMHDVLPALVVLARTLLRADGYAVWLLDPREKQWSIGASHGISEAFSRMLVESFRGEDVSAVAFTEPLIVSSVADTPLLEDRARALRQEGIESMMAVPLTIGGHGTGTLVFYYRTPHEFDEVEVQTARALGNLAAAAITSAELFEAQRRSREQAERANRQTAFLAEASAALGSSLDYEETLRTVAQLAVPQIADWCAVDVVDEHGEVQRLAVSHIDSAQASSAGSAVADVIGFGTALMRPSMIVVPLTAHRRTFGALTFVYADSGRTYSDVDFRFAHDMAYRAALAVENARAGGAQVGDDELASAYEALADVALLAGRYDLARDGLRGARRLCGHETQSQARLCRKEGTLREKLGKHSAALTWYRRGLASLAVLPDAPSAASSCDRAPCCAAPLRFLPVISDPDDLFLSFGHAIRYHPPPQRNCHRTQRIAPSPRRLCPAPTVFIAGHSA
jgi:PAS domain S-box-containing protein